jgi:hypothetical protein
VACWDYSGYWVLAFVVALAPVPVPVARPVIFAVACFVVVADSGVVPAEAPVSCFFAVVAFCGLLFPGCVNLSVQPAQQILVLFL